MNTTLKVKIKCKELSSLFLAKSDGTDVGWKRNIVMKKMLSRLLN